MLLSPPVNGEWHIPTAYDRRLGQRIEKSEGFQISGCDIVEKRPEHILLDRLGRQPGKVC